MSPVRQRQYLRHLSYYLHRKLMKALLARKLKRSLVYVQRHTNAIRTIYDIGARHGEWSAGIKASFPEADFILFEANEKCRPQLTASGFRFVISALSAQSGTARFYDNNSSGDSLFKEATRHYENVEPRIVTTRTLDEVVASHKLAYPDLIKLDTQGAELDILAGGATCLSHAKAVYMECPIIDYNEGAPNIGAYLDAMKRADFVPFDVCEVHRAADVLMQIDILFIRPALLAQINPEAMTKFGWQGR